MSRTIILLILLFQMGCTAFVAQPSPSVPTLPAAMTPILESTSEIEPEDIMLPSPKPKGTFSLEETLANRRSVRAFRDQPITNEELSQLLWAAQGITHSSGLRTAPSAGALYPLEVYVVTVDGVYHYNPFDHSMKGHLKGDVRWALVEAALQQEFIAQAPVVFIIAAVYARIEVKYGKERGARYVHMEVGHAAQNILLQAVALGLGGVPVGAFYDHQVSKVLALPSDHAPLYLIPIGHPK